MTTTPEVGTDEAKRQGCTCYWQAIPEHPEPIKHVHASCPVHGERDPLGLGRVCTICGVTAVSSTNPETDFCRLCWATGQKDARDLDADGRGLLKRLRATPGVHEADVWQTGGGCMVLAITLVDETLLTASLSEEPSMPGPEGPWGVVVSENEEAWSEWDEQALEFPCLDDETDAGLVEFTRQRAAAAREANRQRLRDLTSEDTEPLIAAMTDDEIRAALREHEERYAPCPTCGRDHYGPCEES